MILARQRDKSDPATRVPLKRSVREIAKSVEPPCYVLRCHACLAYAFRAITFIDPTRIVTRDSRVYDYQVLLMTYKTLRAIRRGAEDALVGRNPRSDIS